MQRLLVATFVAAFALAGCEAIYKPINQKRMAPVTINLKHFGGFETGGFEEIARQSTFNANAVGTTPAPWSSKETYTALVKGAISSKGWIQTDSFATGSDWVTFGWYVYADSTVFLDADKTVFGAYDSLGNSHWYMEWRSDIDPIALNFYDDGGTFRGAVTSGVTANTWIRIEVKWKKSATGDMKVYIDGVVKLTISSQDFDTGRDEVAMRWENVLGKVGAGAAPEIHIGSWYFRTDDGASIDTNSTILGRYTVIGPYQDTNSGAPADYGDTLDLGTWANAGELPGNDANYGRYNVRDRGEGKRNGGITTNDGSRPGPQADTRITGTILAASWVWRAVTEITSDTAEVKFKYGATDSVTTDNTVDTSVHTLSTAVTNYRTILAAPHANVPTRTQWFQSGMRINNLVAPPSQAWALLLDQWAFLLHRECGPGIIHRGMVDAGD